MDQTKDMFPNIGETPVVKLAGAFWHGVNDPKPDMGDKTVRSSRFIGGKA